MAETPEEKRLVAYVKQEHVAGEISVGQDLARTVGKSVIIGSLAIGGLYVLLPRIIKAFSDSDVAVIDASARDKSETEITREYDVQWDAFLSPRLTVKTTLKTKPL